MNTPSTYDRAYSEGREAALLAAFKNSGPLVNPYLAGTEAAEAWNAGTTDALADLDSGQQRSSDDDAG